MQFFVTIDTSKPGNFEKFARLMKEIQADWLAPYHAGAELDIEIDNDLHYSKMLQDLILKQDPILEAIPPSMIEQEKEMMDQEKKDIEDDAIRFVQDIREHVKALGVHLGTDVSIQRVTHGLLDELVLFVGPVPEDATDIEVEHKLCPFYADFTTQVQNGTYRMIFSKREDTPDDEYFLWRNSAEELLRTN